jgi:predicted PurR-regulated permease PerM
MNKRLINNSLVGILIIIIFVLSYLVIRPILISITFGLIFAYVFHPVFKKINKSIKIKTLSASILMFLIAFLILAPIVYFTPSLIQQVFSIFGNIKGINFAELVATVFPFLSSNDTVYSILLNVNNLPGKLVSGFMDGIFSMVVNLPNIMLQSFVFLFTFFFTVRDVDKLGEYFKGLSPFSKATEKRFMREFRGITNSVILGQVLIGVLQGMALGLGLLLLGIPNVLTLTIVTAIASIIPIIGAWIVWVPLCIYLMTIGDVTVGIILALYGGLFVSNIDNFIRPYLLSRSSQLPVVVSLIGTIGGLYFLGILGLVLGPLILAYALIIIDFYREGRLDELYRDERRGVKDYEFKKHA